jgi:YHS domain-containing protein
MAGAINKDVYVDYKGERIYFCCPGCEGSFMEKPDEYLEKMRAAGVRPEQLAGAAGDMKPQTHCPVMGGEINREFYADHEGQRVYFCCPGCKEPFLKEAEKHLSKMRAEGIEPERVEVSHEH